VHELSLSGAIVNTVVKHAAGRRVTVVSLRVGALRQVVPDTLAFYFGFVAEQVLIPARVRCDPCEREWEIDMPIFRCPGCGGAAEVVSGEEFEVESIDVEEVECIAPR
jgi:hydrogenase nickel incorporation protein HypA/HybF